MKNMKSIAMVIPGGIAGVKTITDKLVYGLKREKLNVKVFLYGKNLAINTLLDLKRALQLRNFDTIIYMGSIPQLSATFIKLTKGDNKTILFVHGFLFHETLNALRSVQISLRGKIGSLYNIFLWNVGTSTKSIDLFICHSITTCEANKIVKNYIVLPQFVFPEEIITYAKLYQGLVSDSSNHNEVKVLVYTSFALSPRLLKPYHVIRLMKGVSKKIMGRRIQLLIIDPRVGEKLEEYSNLKVRFMKPLQRHEFLQLLAQADLYIERCVDEELGLSSIEAALLGTPVAKLTHPRYVERQDYEDEILWASSPQKFIDMLSDYIQHLDYWKPYYAKKLRDFLATRRSWDRVKAPLIKYILSS